eukprot:m.228477 g.228477  ORF g.228477 m.228477 type:complete len:462 (+) comp18829_c0_seq4:940-2325(+)
MTAMFAVLLGLVASCTLTAPSEAATSWAQISSSLESNFSSYLPEVPTSRLQYDLTQLSPGPFQLLKMDGAVFSSLDTSGLCNQTAKQAVVSPTIAWPSDEAVLGGTTDQGVCRIDRDPNNVLLRFANNPSPNNIWVRPNAKPAWLQFRFPVRTGSTASHITWTLDTRYATNLNGGDPCQGCDLCVDEPWDRDSPAGYYVLLAASGPSSTGYRIHGPFQNLTGRLPVDDSLRTELLAGGGDGEFTVVLLVYSQHPTAEAAVFDQHGRCGTSNKYTIMIKDLVLVTRSPFSLPTQPPVTRPRLFGSDEHWMATFVDPLLTMPCAGDNTRIDWGGVSDFPTHSQQTFSAASAVVLSRCRLACTSIATFVIRTWLTLHRREKSTCKQRTRSCISCGTYALAIAHATPAIAIFPLPKWKTPQLASSLSNSSFSPSGPGKAKALDLIWGRWSRLHFGTCFWMRFGTS